MTDDADARLRAHAELLLETLRHAVVFARMSAAHRREEAQFIARESYLDAAAAIDRIADVWEAVVARAAGQSQ